MSRDDVIKQISELGLKSQKLKDVLKIREEYEQRERERKEKELEEAEKKKQAADLAQM